MTTILVVDDSSYARRIHRRILESGGYAVIEATSGMEALERYFLERPELVLLDLSMEDIGGLEVLGKLREMDPGARVVIVSADVQRSTERLAEEGGALAFVGKPVVSEQLLARVGDLLQGVSS